VLVLAGCTPGGQFDPTEIFNSDMFNTKKKMAGDREPLFPEGVPGTNTGVPKDLVKGYQPPPDQAADSGDAAAAPGAPGAPAAEAAKPQPKPKPKPKLARAPAQPHDAAFDQQNASHPSTRISIGPGPKPGAPAQPAAASQSAWPTPPQAAPAQQTAQPAPSPWPAPPQTAPAQQTAQPAQSVWPNPPASGTFSR
jgi:hypothetical protein